MYWPHKVNEVYKTGKHYPSNAGNRTEKRQNRNRKIFLGRVPPKLVAMNIFCLPSRATSNNQIVVILRARYFQVTQAVPPQELFSGIPRTSSQSLDRTELNTRLYYQKIHMQSLSNFLEPCEAILGQNTSQPWKIFLSQAGTPMGMANR